MIHFILGNTGAGKTTYAQSLKRNTNGILYSIDEWNNTLFMEDKSEGDGLDWFLERIERIEQLIEKLVIQTESSNIHVILDLGFSKFSHRQKWRDYASKNNFQYTLHFLDTPKDIRWKRIQERNNNQGETFEFLVNDAEFNFMESWFEQPTEHELENAVIINA